ncbi:MAG TPA: SUMF1/EgtB/PvdO family nonheme iron enzyme, partial [Herminiimonas sp.]|nr:SUMF1/EgtB/PvdO family nonheme iron enzyme [Herminiimonas sp.]
ALWLSEGWDWVQTQRLARPLYWQKDDSAPSTWQAFTLNGLKPLDMNAAASHISFFEAEAYARWAGARLPTEAEWESAAMQTQQDGASLTQLFDICWQWTTSSYAPYPGYETAEGALGEYNGKFMSNQYVLRGSSSATPDGHGRATYRNFFPATARWQFSGIRLAR